MSNPPAIQNLILRGPKAEDAWKDYAYFLGFTDSDPEIWCIEKCYYNMPALKPQMFLRVRRIPDCGVETDDVVNCLKGSGIGDKYLRIQQSGQGIYPANYL